MSNSEPRAFRIETFDNIPGHHCGSIAMRNLIQHYTGLELSEAMVFGLGSGLDLVLVQSERFEPSVMPFGRSITMELDVGAALGIDYREQPELDNDRAWNDVKREVLAGRPTMLSGDIFHLDYREFKYHFPGHRFVLVGFDDEREVALIGDRVAAQLQECSYGALRKSRNPREGFSTFNLWGKFHGTAVGKSLEDAYVAAIDKAAQRMLGYDSSQAEIVSMLAGGDGVQAVCGLDGIDAYAAGLEEWSGRDDAGSLASIFSRLIEKFGTGGGNFRKMYAEFLRDGLELVPEVVPDAAVEAAERSAEQWTELSKAFAAIAEEPATEERWRWAAQQLRAIASTERELFESLA